MLYEQITKETVSLDILYISNCLFISNCSQSAESRLFNTLTDELGGMQTIVALAVFCNRLRFTVYVGCVVMFHSSHSLSLRYRMRGPGCQCSEANCVNEIFSYHLSHLTVTSLSLPHSLILRAYDLRNDVETTMLAFTHVRQSQIFQTMIVTSIANSPKS